MVVPWRASGTPARGRQTGYRRYRTLGLTLAERLVERDSGRHRDVEARDGSLHRQRQREVAILAGQPPEPAALGPHYERERAGQVSLVEGLFAVLRGAPDPEPGLFHVAQAPREVRDLRERHGLGRAGRDLAHDRRQARRAIARRDDGRRPGG